MFLMRSTSQSISHEDSPNINKNVHIKYQNGKWYLVLQIEETYPE